jgi:putative transposase
VTDKLRSYGVAQRRLLLRAEHRQSRYLNNLAENYIVRRGAESDRCGSNRPSRHLSAHAFIHGHFHPSHHLLSANAYRAIRAEAFDVRDRETSAQHTM